jgi:hypothetical protein
MRNAIALLLVAAAPAAAQLELPVASPNAKVAQTVGLTDITVEYASPAVRGRKIWGALVAYDKPWRAGANAATKVTFSKDVKLDGKPVPAGSYALYVVPSAKAPWTVALSKDANLWGTSVGAKPENDVLRLQVKPQAIAPRERLAYFVTDFTDDKATLALEWEKVRLAVPVQLDTQTQALAAIKTAEAGAWRPWNSAARYMLDKKDYDAGLALVEKSLAAKEDWPNLFTKAQLLAGKGAYADAVTLAKKAEELGQKAQNFYLADEVKAALADWSKKKK